MHNTVRVAVGGALRALGGWGGVQHHGVVVWGWRAARVLPQLRVVMHRPDVATAGEAEAGPGDVGKPRLLAFTGYSQVYLHGGLGLGLSPGESLRQRGGQQSASV